MWLWGKTDRRGISRERGGPAWNPLLAHCLDTAAVCGVLFDRYLSAPVRAHFADAFGGGCPRTARAVVMLLAALHDLPGKAHPAFQQLFAELRGRDEDLRQAGLRWHRQARRAGLPLGGPGGPRPPHAHVTARYLPALLGCRCPDCAYHPHPSDADAPRHEGLHTIATILGGHHGHIPPEQLIADADCALPASWQDLHTAMVTELARLLGVDLARLPALINPQRPAVLPLLAGLVVMCDWIASDETRFTYRTLTEPTDQWWTASRRQAESAVDQLRLHAWQPDPHASWPDLHPATPHPRPAQQAVLDAAPDGPVLAILESSTGSGKTESALWLAHHLAARCGYHGFYLAQATRAASNQLAARCADFLTHALGSRTEANLALVHGTASLSALAAELQAAAGPADLPTTVNLTCDDSSENLPGPALLRAQAVLVAWFLEHGRGLLSPFGVGTIDQIVLAAQASRHWFLRLFGLANKIVIIDEAHSYELFQQEALGHAIAWLADAGASVIVLSATLSNSVRQALVEAWCRGHRTTPTHPATPGPLTFVDPHGTCHTLTPAPPPPGAQPQPTGPKVRTRLRLHADPGPEQLAEHLLTHYRDGITGVIRNRVVPATALFRAAADLAAQAGWDAEKELLLLHGRFLERDRARHAHTLERLLGPHPDPDQRTTLKNPDRPARFLLIGTQVLEQSLDYCLDHLFTDLAPFDYLLQRRGRLWRHLINRLHLHAATPYMHVLFTPGPDGLPRLTHPGGRPIDAYAPYPQAATWHALHDRMPAHGTLELTTPDDTHPILQAIYAPAPPTGTEPIHALLNATFTPWQQSLSEERNQARQRCLPPFPGGVPCGIEELASGHLHTDPDTPDQPMNLGARSRLGEPSTDVIGLYQHPNGNRTWDPEGHQPADLTRYHPRREADHHRPQQREIHLNTVRIPRHWFRGRNALPPTTEWTTTHSEALTGKPVLLLTPEGTPHHQHLSQLHYDPRTGLSRHD